MRGVVGSDEVRLLPDRGVTKRPPSGTAWNGRPQRVTAPYTKGETSPYSGPQVPRDTWNPVGIREDHLPRLNTSQRPIVNQYREGKVKSTPVRGVKEYLKPFTYKLWEGYAPQGECLTACLLHNEPASYSRRQG